MSERPSRERVDVLLRWAAVVGSTGIGAPQIQEYAAEVRALRDENAKLKAEVERLRKVVEAVREMAAFGQEWRVKPLFKALAELDAYDAAREGR